MKPLEKQEARRLRRKEGLSLREISAQVGVAKSTVSLWVRDITLTQEQERQRSVRAAIALAAGAVRRSQYWADRRAAYRQEGRHRAREGDWLHVAGCMLYWGEGSKSRNKAQLVNSDPALIELYARFLRECYGISDHRLRVQIHAYEDLDLEVCEGFWLGLLGLPRSALTKTTLLRSAASSKKYASLRPLPYGTCRLTVLCSVALVQSIYGSLMEYTGRPASSLDFPL